MAQAFAVPTRSVTLVSGATHRTKILEVDIDDTLGEGRLHALLRP